jgi:hypothetical protein
MIQLKNEMTEVSTEMLQQVGGGEGVGAAIGYVAGRLIMHPIDSVVDAWNYWTN